MKSFNYKGRKVFVEINKFYTGHNGTLTRFKWFILRGSSRQMVCKQYLKGLNSL